MTSIGVEWAKPLPLKKVPTLFYQVDLEKVPAEPGIYVFGRRFGSGFEALYVGQAVNIRRRFTHQLDNLRLMAHVRDSPNGQRILMTGRIKVKRGQQVASCLTLAERAFIRFFLAEGHDLVNVMGTKLKQQEVHSAPVPMHFVPPTMLMEK